MKEMTVTELERYIRGISNSAENVRFRYDQSSQTEAHQPGRAELAMWFDRMLVMPSPQTIHLVNSSGTLRISDIAYVSAESINGSRGSAAVITVVCQNKRRHVIMAC